jgi:hypothetical protein
MQGSFMMQSSIADLSRLELIWQIVFPSDDGVFPDD